MPPISLHTIPLDALLHILEFVDPITLINLAQTCQCLRTTIRPTRINLLQRLLALELIPDYGGIVPLIRGRDNQIIPPVDSKDWDSNRYACGGCLKLLPHQMFDNHEILRMPLRKPPPGSREANRLAEWWYLPGWEDDVRGRIMQHRVYTRALEELASLADVRLQHYEATHPDDNMPHHGVDQFLLDPDQQAAAMAARDRTAYNAELLLCGLRRHNRRCNECRFLRGDWRRRSPAIRLANMNIPGNGFKPPLPVAAGRRLPFYNVFDRCFPALFKPVPPSETGRRFTAMGNVNSKVQRLVMFTVRCRSCSTWKDGSMFRLPVATYRVEWLRVRELGQYLVRPDSQMGELKEPKCNQCFLREHGMDAFQRDMVRFAVSLLSYALCRARYQILFGWGKLLRDFAPSPGAVFAKWAKHGAPIVSDFPIKIDNPYDVRTVPNITTPQLDDLKRRYILFKNFVEQMYQRLPPSPSTSRQAIRNAMTSWFRIWYEDYLLYEQTYRRLQQQLEWVEQFPQDLVDYALALDPLKVKRYDFESVLKDGEIVE